jgi:hypothetical protein
MSLSILLLQNHIREVSKEVCAHMEKPSCWIATQAGRKINEKSRTTETFAVFLFVKFL